ncbi:MAG: hypothetical protein ACRYGF_09900 [Janthinobacterium lividum]
MTRAHAQDAQPTVTRTSRVLSHFDLGVSGIALFTKGVSGTVNQPVLGQPYQVDQTASTAAGALVTLRGQKSAFKGFELNYGYGRTAQTYTCCNTNPNNGTFVGPLVAQAAANEFTLGYLVRPERTIFGFKPYISAGAGTMEFKPTRNGGQGLQPQARAAYYYSVGGENLLVGDTLGVRFGVRQLFYKAPDFGQNYLTLKKLTNTFEPQIGLYLHF